MSLSKSGCIYKGTVIHEILHAMGFWHEQNRPDRDNYVKISYENIRDGMADQFEKYTSGKYFSTPYDFKSIMHYDEYSFSKNGLKTITPLQAGIDIIPSYNRQDSELLSSLDIQAIRSRYSCAGTAPITTTTTTTTTTTIVSACVDADPTCIYFYNNVNKNTYCTLNYSLNGVRFSTGNSKKLDNFQFIILKLCFFNSKILACRKLCGVCV